MNKKELFDVMERMKETIGAEQLLNEICQALSSQELEENLLFIDSMTLVYLTKAKRSNSNEKY